MRVLTSPAQTGAVTLALPQDVQAEAWDYPEELFEKRVWHIAAAEPERACSLAPRDMIRAGQAAADRRRRRRALQRGHARRWRVRVADGIPVGETQAGKGSLPFDHPQNLGAIGVTGTLARTSRRARPTW